jgi:hypothetical protein
MISQMMKECCGEDAMSDLEKMKGSMQMCGKSEFSDGEIQMMQQFCGQSGTPDPERMKQCWRSAAARRTLDTYSRPPAPDWRAYLQRHRPKLANRTGQEAAGLRLYSHGV